MDPYLETIELLLRRGRHTNSYKFALLRALVDYARQNQTGDWRIRRSWLAERFVEYYWPLAVQFHVRQAHDPGKAPVVMTQALALAESESISPEMPIEKVQASFPEGYGRLVSAVETKAFGDVIPRFHNLPSGHVSRPIYTFDKQALYVARPAAEALKSNAPVLEQLAIAAWVRFTEQFTSAPRLYEKIAGVSPSRRGLKPYEVFLRGIQGDACFYCGRETLGASHVDHAIPWSFVLEDQVWNLVLACDQCNLEKGARHPTSTDLDRLSARNERILELPRDSLPSRIRKDLEEWRTSDLGGHMRLMAERCAADGFGEWKPTLKRAVVA